MYILIEREAEINATSTGETAQNSRSASVRSNAESEVQSTDQGTYMHAL